MREKPVTQNHPTRLIGTWALLSINEPGFPTIQLHSNNGMQPDAATPRR